MLLDYNLRRLGIDPGSIRGYRREEFTHMAVASAVKSGSADAGLGILSAARALDLDFVQVTEERYEIAIPARHMRVPAVERMIEALRTREFVEGLKALGGYDTRDTGTMRVVSGG